jgi:hypothetical protein
MFVGASPSQSPSPSALLRLATARPRFPGFFAWLMWRTIHLGKLPRFEKKFQLALHWTMDLFFPKQLTQLLTAAGIRKAAQSLETSKDFFDPRDHS